MVLTPPLPSHRVSLASAQSCRARVQGPSRARQRVWAHADKQSSLSPVQLPDQRLDVLRRSTTDTIKQKERKREYTQCSCVVVQQARSRCPVCCVFCVWGRCAFTQPRSTSAHAFPKGRLAATTNTWPPPVRLALSSRVLSLSLKTIGTDGSHPQAHVRCPRAARP